MAKRDSPEHIRLDREGHEEADRRWHGLYSILVRSGISPKLAAYGATATVFGIATAALLYA